MTVNSSQAGLRARVEAAKAVALKVGRETAAFRASADAVALDVRNKGLQDFVTIADKQAEDTIRQALLGAFPLDGFIGEEGGEKPGMGGAWIVDPIDGTTNFIRGYTHWAVSIAYVEGEDVLIGVVYDAAQDAVFHAVRGEGAFKDGVAIRAASTSDAARAIVMLGHSRRTAFEDYLELSRRLHATGADYRRMGAAALGLVRVAEGVADLYFEKHISAWDMMAGLLIAREAGAVVLTRPVSELLNQGGAIAACAPGLTDAFAFVMAQVDISG